MSSSGLVRSLKTNTNAECGRILSRLRGDGYWQVNLHKDGDRRTVKICWLVASAFLGPRPEGLLVRHLDGDSWRDCSTNLAYGTDQENYEDARRHGTYSHGERHGKSELTEREVQRMRNLRRTHTLKTLAKLFDTSVTNVSDICRRKTWTHI